MRAVKQPRALATRDKIVQATARLFALKGFHDTKLEEVLADADATTGAFFHHFQSKEDLAFAVLDRHMEKRRQTLDDIERTLPAPRGGDPLQLICRRLDAIQEMARRRLPGKGGCIIGNLSTALSDTHESFRKRLARCFDEMAREFEPLLDAAQKQHGSQRRCDTRELARYVVSIIEGAIMLARTYRDRRLMARQLEHLKQYLKQAVGA